MKHNKITLSRAPCTCLVVLLVECTPSALSQTWNGGGADNNWTTPANWNPDGAPANNGTANIIMAGIVRTNPVTVNVAQDILSMVFNNTAEAFTISGTTLTIRGGGITNNDTQQQSFSCPILVAAPQTWAAAAGTLSFGGNITLNANLTINTDPGGVQILSAITGPGGLTKDGASFLVLYAGNTYTGGTTISAGTLLQVANNVIPSGVVTLTGSAILNINGFTQAINQLEMTSASATVSLPGSSSLTIDSSFSPVNGVISGDSTATLTKVSGNQLRLAGNNTFTGTYRILAGSLQTLASERLANSAYVVVEGGFLDLQSFTETLDVVTLKSGGIFNNTGGTLIGNVYNLESGFVQKNLGGSASLTKSTAGNVSLLTPCSYTGATSVSGGTLTIFNSNVLPDTTTVNVGAGASLVVNTGQSETIAGLTGSGGVALPGSPGSFSVGAGNVSSAFNGVLSGSNVQLIKIGTGTLTLGGANTYSGVTTVGAGTLAMGASGVLPVTSQLTVSEGNFDLMAFDETVDIMTLSSGSIFGTGTLTASAFNVQAGTISANLSGPAAVTKSTGGAVTLGGSNTYTGDTTINGGILEVGSDANLGALSAGLVFDAGTLRTTNSMTMNRPISLASAGGTLDVSGTLTLNGAFSGTGALTKAGLGRLVINSVAPQFAALSVNTGDLDLPVGGTLSVTGLMSVAAAGFVRLDDGMMSAISFLNSGEIAMLGDARLHGPLSNSGTLSGSGRVSGALVNTSTGEVRVGDGESLHLTATSGSTNAGVIEVIEGEIEFDGSLSNAGSSGLIFARHAILRFNGGLTNAGSVGLSFGISDVLGDVTNQNGAAIVVSGGSDATFVDDVVNNGAIRTSAGSNSVFFGAVSGTGSFPGTGTVFLEGDLRPGASPARVAFGGDLVFGSFSALEIELGGAVPGTEHDQIAVAQTAALDGLLDVVLINGFSPANGDTFDVLVVANIQGTFLDVSLPPGFTLQYFPDRVRLAFGTGCDPCDTNCDGSVNAFDIQLFVDALGPSPLTPCSPCAADTNGDGSVNGFDIQPFIECLAG